MAVFDVQAFEGAKAQVVVMAEAVRATARYFDVMKKWSDLNQDARESHLIPEGAEPELDAALAEALIKVKEAILAIGR